jgi:hypothetical protein
MSAAGILASSLFSNPIAQLGQSLSGSTNGAASTSKAGNGSGSSSSFASVQQQLLAQIPGAAATGSAVTAGLTKLGQDLGAGNLPSAQADFANLRSMWSHAHKSGSTHSLPTSGAGSQTNKPSQSSSQTSNDLQSSALAAALQAYSSMQSSPITSALGGSLGANASTFAADF